MALGPVLSPSPAPVLSSVGKQEPRGVPRPLAPLANLLYHPREGFNILGLVFSAIRWG